MRIIVGSGGTGGHLYPALALVEYIEKQEPSEVLFVGTTNRLESKVVPELGYDYVGLNVKGMVGNPLNKAKNALLFLRSILKARRVIKKFKPDVVVGFGGYPSASVVMAATLLKVPTMIHEQNSIIGLTNRILVKRVDKIVACYQEAFDNFPQEKTYLYGNPRASVFVSQPVNDVYEKYGLDRNLPIVTMVMGSLGSKSINDKMVGALKENQPENFTLVYVTGKNYYDIMKEQMGNIGPNLKLVPYIDDMSSLMKTSTLMVSRGGASTIAELTAIGKPAILIPSPYVVKNHQEYNARELVDANAATMILENDLDGTTLLEQIATLIKDQPALETMHQASIKLGKPDACSNIYALIKTMI